MTKIINLTPHAITIDLPDGNTRIFPPSGDVARVSASFQEVGTLDGIPLSQQVLGEVTGLPDPSSDAFLIVSFMVADALPDRDDLLVPNTGNARRDSDGRIVAVPGFLIKK